MRAKIIAYFKLLRFYQKIFSFKKIAYEGLNILLKERTSFPVTISMLITNKCNFSCKMCLQVSGDASKEKDLDFDTVQRFISSVKRFHPVIHWGGGEPFMRRDILDIVATIKESKLKCLMTTNGSLLNKDIAQKLIGLKIDTIIFSLYGWGNLHDEITGFPGSFERSIANLKMILQEKIRHTRILVSTLILPENIEGIKQLLDNLYIMKVDGVKIEHLNFLTTKECNTPIDSENNDQVYPSVFKRQELFSQRFVANLVNLCQDIRRNYRDFAIIKPFLSDKQIRDWFSTASDCHPGCSFTSHSVFINYNGDIVPCQASRNKKLGNIRDDFLGAVWLSNTYKEHRKLMKNKGTIACLRCCKK